MWHCSSKQQYNTIEAALRVTGVGGIVLLVLGRLRQRCVGSSLLIVSFGCFFLVGFYKGPPELMKLGCLHQDIGTSGEAFILRQIVFFSDALPHSDDVNINIGGLVSVSGLG